MADAVSSRAHAPRLAPVRPAPHEAPGRADPRLRPPLRVVPPGDRSRSQLRRRRRLLQFGTGLLLALLLFSLVSVHVLLTQGQFRLEHLQARAQEQEARYQDLRLQVAQLEAPERIVDEARRRGMVRPPSVEYLAPTPQSSAEGSSRTDEPTDPSGAGSWSTVKPHLEGRP